MECRHLLVRAGQGGAEDYDSLPAEKRAEDRLRVSCRWVLVDQEPDRRVFLCFSSRRRHARYWRDWSSDVCSSDLRWRGPQADPFPTALPASRPRFASGLRTSRSATAETAGRGGSTFPSACSLSNRRDRNDRKSVVQGMSVDPGGRRIIKKEIGRA